LNIFNNIVGVDLGERLKVAVFCHSNTLLPSFEHLQGSLSKITYMLVKQIHDQANKT